MSRNSEHSSVSRQVQTPVTGLPSPEILEEAMAARSRIRARIEAVADRIVRQTPESASVDRTGSSDEHDEARLVSNPV